MKEDFFHQKEIKKIRRIAGGDTYTIIYLKLMLLSLKNEGKLFFDGIEESIAEEIALEIDEDSNNVQTVLGLLLSMKLLEEIPDGVELSNIKEYIGKESESTQRVREYRSRQKLLQCNANVTTCNTEIEIDIDKEKEIDTDKELNKEKKKDKDKTITSVLNSYAPGGGELRNALDSFREMRSKMKKPLTVRALEKALNELDKLSCGDEMTKIAIVDQTLQHGWQTFYGLKANNQYNTRQQKSLKEEADDLASYIDAMNGGGQVE